MKQAMAYAVFIAAFTFIMWHLFGMIGVYSTLAGAIFAGLVFWRSYRMEMERRSLERRL